MNHNVTIVLRGDTFRPVTDGNKFPDINMKIGKSNLESEINQIFCLKSIYHFIILPFIKKKYEINIVGVIYEFEKNNIIRNFFSEKKISNNIIEISRQDSSQNTTMLKALERAVFLTNPELFIVLRLDLSFIKEIPINILCKNKIAYPHRNCYSPHWHPKNGIGDHLFVIGCERINMFLHAIKSLKTGYNLHNICKYLDLGDTIALFENDNSDKLFYIDLQRMSKKMEYIKIREDLEKIF